MNARKPSRRQMLSSCAEVREDDGIDPQDFFKPEINNKKTNRKTLQLCSQIADTMNVLLPDCHDELLHLLQVASVVPAPDASQLLVMVYPIVQGDKPFDPNEVLDHLAQAAGYLRSEVAAAITRKRVPSLLFQVAACPPGKDGAP
jgi:ribosome-binding factor A